MFPNPHELTNSRASRPRDGGGAVSGQRVGWRAPGQGNRHGGVMRIRRALVIPGILALSVAGSVLSVSAASAAVVHPASVHVVAGGKVTPHTYYHI